MKRPYLLYLILALQCVIFAGIVALFTSVNTLRELQNANLGPPVSQQTELPQDARRAAAKANADADAAAETVTQPPRPEPVCRDSTFTMRETNRDPNGDGTCKVLTIETTYRRTLCQNPDSDTSVPISTRSIGPYRGSCSGSENDRPAKR